MKVKNWEKFQHYKNRKPPWIRLYRDLLDDPEFFELSGAAVKHLLMFWLIASEDPGMAGELPAISVLAFRLRISITEVEKSISELSHWLECDASTELSTCPQDAPESCSDQIRDRGETEGEARTRDQYEEDKDKEAIVPPHPLVALCLELWPQWPQDQIEQSVLAWGSAGLNITPDILRAAKAYQNPREPYSKNHGLIVHQAQFAARSAEREKAHTTGRPQPEEFVDDDDGERMTNEEREAMFDERKKRTGGEG